MSPPTQDVPSHDKEREPDYDGTGTGHEPYGDAAYRGRGQSGDEVADALESELAEQYGAEDAAGTHLSGRMQREREQERSTSVPRLAEHDRDDDGSCDDLIADSATDGVDSDRHELSAEEVAMHYVDVDDDRIPE
jgi:hypothetical protein